MHLLIRAVNGRHHPVYQAHIMYHWSSYYALCGRWAGCAACVGGYMTHETHTQKSLALSAAVLMPGDTAGPATGCGESLAPPRASRRPPTTDVATMKPCRADVAQSLPEARWARRMSCRASPKLSRRGRTRRRAPMRLRGRSGSARTMKGCSPASGVVVQLQLSCGELGRARGRRDPRTAGPVDLDDAPQRMGACSSMRARRRARRMSASSS